MNLRGPIVVFWITVAAIAVPAQSQTPVPSSSPAKIVLVALGDSITRSNGASNGCLGTQLVPQPKLMDWLTLYQNVTGNVGFTGRGKPCGGNGWVDRLATLLQSDGPVEVVNASSVGATVSTAETYETLGIPDDATDVVIAEGTPDEMRIAVGKETVADLEAGLAELIDVIRTKVPQAKLFVSLLPDLSKLPVMPAGTGPNPVTAANPQNVADGTVTRYLQAHAEINRFVRHLGVVAVDPYCNQAIYQQVSSDGFHPNDAGHAIIAQAFFAAMHGRAASCK